jgi:hypothetical protein
MDQLKDLADDRLILGCIYCGGSTETRDHVPSRIFLDTPYPENLPVVGCCLACNNGFSLDEEYLACLLESAISGSADPDKVGRQAISNILRRKPALRVRIESDLSAKEGEGQNEANTARIKNVLLKLAKGHRAFECSQVFPQEPTSIWWCPLDQMEEGHRQAFDDLHMVKQIGEVGSRNSQRTFVAQLMLRSLDGQNMPVNMVIQDWMDVQEGRYRYLAIDDDDQQKVKIVISEYLACEVSWTQDQGREGDSSPTP